MITWRGWAVVLVAALGGCQPLPPRQVAMRQYSPVLNKAGPEPVQGPAGVAARWSFSAARTACTAHAAALHAPLDVTVRVDDSVHVTMASNGRGRFAAPGGHGPAMIAFAGPGGRWRLHGSRRGGTASATRPLDDSGVTDLLAAVEGGAFTMTAGRWRSGALDVPGAGVSGRDWIGCVRGRQHAPTAPATG